MGAAQGVVKAFTRLGQASTVPLSVPLRLAAGPNTWGGADCSHALIVGDPHASVEENRGIVKVIASGTVRGEAKLAERDGRVTLAYTDDAGTHVADITDQCVALGKPESVKCGKERGRDHVIKVVCATKRAVQNPRIAHSTGGGCVWTDAREYLRTHAGKLNAFRLRDPATRGVLAARAGHVAITWAVDVLTRAPDAAEKHYSKWKAFASILGTSHYGSNAQARAAKYRLHRDTAGGPPSDKSWGLSGNKTLKKEWFCSMFAIACYQAATTDDAQVARCLALDAKHTSPMMLDGYIRRSGLWDLVGDVNA